MTTDPPSRAAVYSGWDGYQVALVRAIAPHTPDQLRWHPAPSLRSAGEIARHLCTGRVDWFQRTFGTQTTTTASRVGTWQPEERIEEDPAELGSGLETSWQMLHDAFSR
jgi:hypothetical protein